MRFYWDNGEDWALSRYDQKYLYNKKPTVTEIMSGGNGLFEIVEVRDRSIWIGASDGVYVMMERPLKDFKK